MGFRNEVEGRFLVLCLWFYIAMEERLRFCLLKHFYHCYNYIFGGVCILIRIIHNKILSIAADTCALLMLHCNHSNILVPENSLVFQIFMTNVPEICSRG